MNMAPIVNGVIRTRPVPDDVPKTCPVCGEAGYRDSDVGSVHRGIYAVRYYDCGLRWDEEFGGIDFAAMSLSGARNDVAVLHFTRLLANTPTPFREYTDYKGDKVQ